MNNPIFEARKRIQEFRETCHKNYMGPSRDIYGFGPNSQLDDKLSGAQKLLDEALLEQDKRNGLLTDDERLRIIRAAKAIEGSQPKTAIHVYYVYDLLRIFRRLYPAANLYPESAASTQPTQYSSLGSQFEPGKIYASAAPASEGAPDLNKPREATSDLMHNMYIAFQDLAIHLKAIGYNIKVSIERN